MAVKTKKTFPNAVGANGQSSTVFTPVEVQLNNQDDLDVYVTLSGGTRVLQLRQSSGSTATSSHKQVNDTTGLYFPAVSAGTTLYNYTLSTDNNTITFSTALPSGAVVSIERRTRDADSSYTTFASGSTIRATDLNNSSTESNFTAQEARNKAFEIEGALFSTGNISGNFVTSDNIVDGSINTADLANGAVDTDKINSGAVTTVKINDSAVTTGKINDLAVTSSKIANGAVVTSSIGTEQVSTSKIKDLNVTTVKIADDAVTQAKIADDAVGTNQIAAGSIIANRLSNDAVTTDKINNDAVTNDKLADSIVSAIAANTAKNTNVSTNLSTSTTTTAVTVASSDGTNATIGEATSSAAGVMSSLHHNKLDSIEAGAEVNPTNAEIRAAVEAATDSNVFTDNDHSKLNAIEAGATGDQTNAEIRAAVEAATDSNVFTDADHTKLNNAATLTDSQTLTNKTLTTPVINDFSGTAIVTSGTSTSDNKVYSAKRSDELYSTGASQAAASATAAAASATTASTQATNAATSATTASTQASNAATSATTATTQATNATTQAASTLSNLNEFKGIYLGELTSDPIHDSLGNVVNEGDLYFSTSLKRLRVYNGAAWAGINEGALELSKIATTDFSAVYTASAGSNTINLGGLAISGAVFSNEQIATNRMSLAKGSATYNLGGI